MGYVGGADAADFREKATFVRITGAGQRESHAHDVTITRESPNYPGRLGCNQFEIPVLFYVVCLAAFQTGAAAGAGFIVLAWLFVLSRFVHAWVHMTSNRVILRRRVFMVGYFALVVMWGWFAVHLASGAGGPL
jgi:hypothetical protein